ncbi:MAG: sigma-54 dependent transcriptional regulator [Acidobacteriota bacterium]
MPDLNTSRSSSYNLRITLCENDRPIKILDQRPLAEEGVMVIASHSGAKAEKLLTEQPFDVSQLDFEVAGVGRFETRRHHRQDGDTEMMVIELENEPSALPGALEDRPEPHDHRFLTRPMPSDALRRMALAAKGEGRDRIEAARQGAPGQQPILGDSEAMFQVLGVVERVAAGSASVLIDGETGTGKTLVARRIHDLSPRADQRFVAINCSAFQDQLLESELFGHEKGAFTGALATKQGLFEVADGGTLFLDEVGDMTSAMQAKLLQVLDDGALRRVGGRSMLRVNVRVIAASNKNLQQEVRNGNFREDLLFRLRVIHLQMPPLRDRKEDIPRLIEHFLDRYRLPKRPRKRVSPEAIQFLTHYSWPGNVRELANTIEGLILLAPDDEIRAEDLPPALRPRRRVELQDAESPLPMKEMERLHIQRTLGYTEGKKAAAARLLGIDVKTLNNKIKSYEIELP